MSTRTLCFVILVSSFAYLIWKSFFKTKVFITLYSFMVHFLQSIPMRGTTTKLAELIVYFLIAFTLLHKGNTQQIFGTRISKETAEVLTDADIFLTVFGTDLPSHNYFLSTTDRCEDSHRADIISKKIIPLRTDSVFKHAVRLHAQDGVEFSEKFSTFQVCNEAAISSNKLLLQMTAPTDEGIFTPTMILLICTTTLIISSYCSGVNFAYMRMSINDMLLIMENGDEPHKTHVRKIYKYRRQSNWLICTMAVMNTIVNTVFTNTISNVFKEHKYAEILTCVVPTIMIVLLAEILPQSICNRFGLMIAATTRHITLLLFIVCAPIAWPFSKIIDYILGREVREIYSEEKLKALIKVQSKKMEEAAQGDILARIVDFPKKTVQDMMTPMEDAFVVSSADKLDLKLLVTILEKGYTRIPVFEENNRHNLQTVLNVKDLATMTIDQRSTVRQFIDMVESTKTQMRFVLAAQKGEAVMEEMMRGDHHLCAVMRFSYGRYRVVGIITFEDVIEEVFGDIEDDSDKMWNSRRAGIHKDQQTLDWFRLAEAEQPIGLSVNATLRLIQSVFDICPLLVTLGYDVLRMKNLFTMRKPKQLDEDENVKQFSDRKMLIFFSGSITVESSRMVTYRLDANRSDFRPYIWGKSLVKRVFKERLNSLSCLGEPLGLRTQLIPPKIRAITTAKYFELSANDILNGLRDPGDVRYEYCKVGTPSETAHDTFDTALATLQGNYELESTQCSPPNEEPIRRTTPQRRSEILFEKYLTPRLLRASLEKLSAIPPNTVQSDSVTEVFESQKGVNLSDACFVTAREPLVRPGPPPKFPLIGEDMGSVNTMGSKAVSAKKTTTTPAQKPSKPPKNGQAYGKQDIEVSKPTQKGKLRAKKEAKELNSSQDEKNKRKPDARNSSYPQNDKNKTAQEAERDVLLPENIQNITTRDEPDSKQSRKKKFSLFPLFRRKI